MPRRTLPDVPCPVRPPRPTARMRDVEAQIAANLRALAPQRRHFLEAGVPPKLRKEWLAGNVRGMTIDHAYRLARAARVSLADLVSYDGVWHKWPDDAPSLSETKAYIARAIETTRLAMKWAPEDVDRRIGAWGLDQWVAERFVSALQLAESLGSSMGTLLPGAFTGTDVTLEPFEWTRAPVGRRTLPTWWETRASQERFRARSALAASFFGATRTVALWAA